MEFKKEENRIYLAGDDGSALAEITFRKTSPETYDIDHTFVDDSLRGQGIAGKLVAAAVDEIKSRGARVTASCSYAAGWLEKHGI